MLYEVITVIFLRERTLRRRTAEWQPQAQFFFVYTAVLLAFVVYNLFMSGRYVIFLNILTMPLIAIGLQRTFDVITSYSIHYTKLYDEKYYVAPAHEEVVNNKGEQHVRHPRVRIERMQGVAVEAERTVPLGRARRRPRRPLDEDSHLHVVRPAHVRQVRRPVPDVVVGVKREPVVQLEHRRAARNLAPTQADVRQIPLDVGFRIEDRQPASYNFV